MISVIAAIGKNRELGKDNRLLWHISEDFKRFKKLTSGHTVIMGRKTFESLGKPLQNRTNIVITRNTFFNFNSKYFNSKYGGYHKICSSKNCDININNSFQKLKNQNQSQEVIICFSLEKAIEIAKEHEESLTNREVFIIGGGQIYQQAIKFTDKLYLTIVEGEYKADTFFPDYAEFKKVVFEEKHQSGGYKYKFLELEK